MAKFVTNNNVPNHSSSSAPIKSKHVVTTLYNRSDGDVQKDLIYLDVTVTTSGSNLYFVTPLNASIDSDSDVKMAYIIYDRENNEIDDWDDKYFSTSEIAHDLIPITFIKNSRDLFQKKSDSLLPYFKNVADELERNRNILKLEEKKEGAF